MKWCFGTAGEGRVLTVANNRRYPLEVLHPDLAVLDPGKIDYLKLMSVAHVASGPYTIIAPGDEATFSVNLNVGETGEANANLDELGEILFELQTLTTYVVLLLKALGVAIDVGGAAAEGDAAPKVAVDAVSILNKLITIDGCADGLDQKAAGAAIAACFSPKVIDAAVAAVYGPIAAALVVALIIVGPLVDFFASFGTSIYDYVTEHDDYDIKITRSSAPTCPSAASVFSYWINHGGQGSSGGVTGFDDLICWQQWVVVNVEGNGNGDLVFSQLGGLHVASLAEQKEFNSQVCSDPSAPSAFKNPGIAICPLQ